MDNKILNKCIFGAMLLSLAACTQDDLGERGTALPYGEYPLQISSVTLTADVNQQSWSADVPQTRVSENTDRNSSVWDGGERIGVQIVSGTETAVYTLQSNKTTLQPANKPLYWKNTTASKVCAWFPADGEVDLSKQTSELHTLSMPKQQMRWITTRRTLTFLSNINSPKCGWCLRERRRTV